MAQVLHFPRQAPFAVHIKREDTAWLVVCRGHGWLFGDRRQAVREARALAGGFGCRFLEDPKGGSGNIVTVIRRK
jgi:hypothetical protein